MPNSSWSPNFNFVGWLAKDVATAIYGYSKAKIVAGPHVYGGMSMPVEMIFDEIECGLTGKKSATVPSSALWEPLIKKRWLTLCRTFNTVSLLFESTDKAYLNGR